MSLISFSQDCSLGLLHPSHEYFQLDVLVGDSDRNFTIALLWLKIRDEFFPMIQSTML